MNLPLAWLATIIVSIAIGRGIYINGVNGDCKPHEIDGQCGMSSFAGLIEGVLVGLAFFALVAVFLSVLVSGKREL
jgi:hypothetical protein